MEPCKQCPFWATNRGTLDLHLVTQMEINAEYLSGFPCHMRHPGNDILSCPAPAQNANDCVGYQRMRTNMTSGLDVHPEVVGCLDELIG